MAEADVRVVLEAVLEDVDRLQDVVAGLWLDHATVPARDRIRFETALVEIFGNIVEHSVRRHPGPPFRRVDVRLEVTDETLVGRFADDGRPVAIDLGAVTMPGTEAEAGRGLALALAAVDDLDYVRDGAVNRWTVTCRRSSA